MIEAEIVSPEMAAGVASSFLMITRTTAAGVVEAADVETTVASLR